MRTLPGDPLIMYLSQDDMADFSTEELDKLRHEWGMDRPMAVQYIDWVGGVLHGDLGTSMFTHVTVSSEIIRALPKTLYIGSLAFLLSIIVGVPAGVIAAIRRGGWLDTVVTMFANLGITIPIFWMGILTIYLFGLYLGWLPIQGYTSPLDDFWLSTRKIILPVFCLSIFAVAASARQTRSSMLEVIQQDYIRFAYSKGLPERVVIMRHALKNGLIPVITLKGMHVSMLFGGSVLIETVFNIPGMGRLAVDGVFSLDYAIVQGVILIIAAVVTISNLVVDISYGWFDPRVRYR